MNLNHILVIPYNLRVMRRLASNPEDLIVTDPPFAPKPRFNARARAAA